ncbi:MAG: TIGR04282 family arsenosugar biosynthesis glycosyltransferase [Rhodanobacteraceae bacterium]
MTTALAIFVKTPGHSPIKTRLAATIGARSAIEFHRLAAQAVAEVAQATCDGMLACQWAVAENAALEDPLWQGLPRVGQGEGNLGARLHYVYARLRTTHERVLLLGADTPQITPELLLCAIDALERGDVPFVLGPARDGGFWLFGGRAPIARESWCNVGYSRSDTAAQLRKALHMRDGLAVLPILTDVDSASDLAVLADALSALPAPTPAQRALMRWLQGAGNTKAACV